jgi:hypothetical protein
MSLSFSANFGSFDSLNVRMRCGASWWASRMRWTDRKLTPAAFASARPVQWVASPGGGPSAKSTTRCAVSGGSGGLPGLRVLSRASPSTPSRHEPCLPPPHHRFRLARAAHDLGSPAALGGREDDFGPPNMLLRSAAIRNDRLKPTAIFRRDVHHNSCSHNESLNCFGRFGNRPNESDH